ncbi:hypothetical protein [Methanococcus maripaludis]|uniref:Polysaccharide deacetylase n=1 Tax=Methanococcus maripaludis TaxID=39152 RepID=A0A7J9PWF4_METMI|nr:hypothetical protein [Methanococcus maripaludis]MBA2869070.1 hypothetical protein [Methanococcus maripaludis]
MDFTLDKYAKLISVLDKNYDICTVYNYLLKKPESNFLILRHDIDRKPENALKMAKLEYDLGINSTYYFRYPYTFDVSTMEQVADLGHEVGYHYETLAKAEGKFEKAFDMFFDEFSEFKKLFDIKTICMHGRPLSRYDNRDLWKKYNFKDYGIAGEAYLSICDDEITYITDTGRNWNNKSNLRDKSDWKSLSGNFNSTDDLIQKITTEKPEKLYINTHSERWSEKMGELFIGHIKDKIMNTGKKVIKIAVKV